MPVVLFFESALKAIGPVAKVFGKMGLPQGVATVLPVLATALLHGLTLIRESTLEHKKKVLREKVVSLRGFVASFPERDLSDAEIQVLHDANAERLAAVDELAKLAVTVAVRPRSRFRKVFLLYTPEPRWVLVLHTLFYISVLELALILVALAIDWDDAETRFAMFLASTTFTLFAALMWGVSTDLDRGSGGAKGHRNALQRWLLAYQPARPWMWVLHIVFVWMLVTAIAVAFVFRNLASGEAFGDWLELALPGLVGVVCWSLATDVEHRTVRPPGMLRRAFLLYAPSRPARWTLHVFFYSLGLMALAGISDTLTGRIHYDPASFAVVPILFFVLSAWVVRDIATGTEPWGGGIPRRVAWLKIGSLPGSWFRRLLFFACGLLFYSSVCLWPVIAHGMLQSSNGGIGLNGDYLLRIVAPVVAIGFLARWGARRLGLDRVPDGTGIAQSAAGAGQ